MTVDIHRDKWGVLWVSAPYDAERATFLRSRGLRWRKDARMWRGRVDRVVEGQIRDYMAECPDEIETEEW